MLCDHDSFITGISLVLCLNAVLQCCCTCVHIEAFMALPAACPLALQLYVWLLHEHGSAVALQLPWGLQGA